MKILVLSGGMHPFHQSTPILIHFLIEHGFEVNLTEDPNYLLTYDMTKYDALIFNTRRVEELTLSNEQQKGLTNYVANGKGFVAIHVGAGLPESWPEYHDLTGGGWVYGGTSAAHPPSKHTVTISDKSHPCAKGLKDFEGVERRFTKLFSLQGVPFFDDYAHHPTEIKEVLNGVKEVYKNKEIICVFQPHRISRVKNLKKDFSLAFKKADTVVLCPIYKAGENISLGFTYLNFAREIIKNSNIKLILIKNNLDLAKFVKQNIYGDKIVIGMGAGSISNWMRKLPKL